MSDAVAGHRARIRVSLGDMIGWVVAVGVVTALVRESGVERPGMPSFGVDRVLDVSAVGLAIFFALALVRQAFALSREARAAGRGFPSVGVGWRLAVVCAALVFAVDEVRLLDAVKLNPLGAYLSARVSLAPVAATLVMAGVIAGLTPERARRPPKSRAWLSVLCAGFAGMAFAASASLIPYLVLIAIEAVSLARHPMGGPKGSWPSLHERLGRVCWDLAPVLISCLVTGVWVSRELRRPGGRGGLASTLGLLASAGLTGVGSAWLLLVTIPRLHPNLGDGIWLTIRAPEAAAIVLGFSGLASGLAARAADRPGRPATEEIPTGRWNPLLRGIVKVVAVVLLLDLIVTRLYRFVYQTKTESAFWEPWIGWVDAGYVWLHSVVPSALDDVWTMAREPEWLALILTQVWVGCRVVVLLLTPMETCLSPIDATLSDRHALARFAARAGAMMVVMVAALPALFLTGLVVLHALLRRGG